MPECTVCAEEGHTVSATARGLCQKHYRHWYKLNGRVGPKKIRSCAVSGCRNKYRCSGYCTAHYRAWQRYGNPLHVARPWREHPCSVKGCDEPNDSKGYCKTHAWRIRVHGKVGPAELTRSYVLVHGTVDGYKHHNCRCVKCREAKRLAEISWRAKNRESVRATQARYQASKPEAVAGYRRKWKRLNPAKVGGYTASRVRAPFDAEALVYADLIKSDPCVYCGKPSNEIDHIIPVSVSRSSAWDNLAPICDSCNSSKQDKSLLNFMLYRQWHEMAIMA